VVTVNFLWVSGALSLVEKLALSSFRDHGHQVNLYTYDSKCDIPGVNVLDAGEILPSSRTFTYGAIAGRGRGSLAGFANLFRYKLLLERGGYWADTDVIALSKLPDVDTFFAWTDTTPTSSINNAVLALPKGSLLATQLFEIADAAPPESQRWGECGPQLMTTLVKLHGLESAVYSASSVHPIPFPDAPRAFRADLMRSVHRSIANSHAVHLWNEVLRQHGINKNGPFPRTSLIATLAHRHGLS
jgi:hypothetical protein